MSVDTTTFKQEFTMDSGATKSFTFTFAALYSSPTDIKCIKINATLTESTLAYTTDYTVAVNVDGSGGVLTVVNSSGTDTLLVYRDTTDKQESSYSDYNQFPAKTVERDIDRRTLKSQELDDAINRAVKFSITSDISAADLPTPVDGKVLVWSGTGGTLVNSTFLLGSYNTITISAATVAQNAATSAATSATAAAASELAAAASETAAAASENAASTSATTATAQANIATTQANIAITQATLAISAASISVTQATLAISAASIAVTYGTLANSASTVATAQANIATTQATLSTSAASISVTQASLAISAATVAVAAAATIPTPTTGTIGGFIRVADPATSYEHVNLGATTPGTAGCIVLGIPTTGATPTFTTQCDYNKLFGSAGRASGGVITSASTTSIDVSAGTGFIKATDSDTAELLSFDWAALSGEAVSTSSTTYVAVKYNGGAPLAYLTATEDWDLDTSWPLGKVVQEGGDIHILCSPWWVTDGITNVIERFEAEGFLIRDANFGGLIVSGSATRQVAVTAGKLWSRLNEFDIAAFNFGDTFELYHRTTSTIWTETDVTTTSNLMWNDLSTNTLETIDNNKYVNFWIYAEADDDEVAAVYPQAQYVSAAAAEAEAPPTNVPNHIQEHGILIGRMIVKQGTTAPIQTQSAFDTVFAAAAAADHGNLTGLSDDDHVQYVHITGTRSATIPTITITTSATIATLNATTVNLADAGKIVLDVVPAATTTGTGIIASMAVTANTVGIGSALHLDISGQWLEANAGAAATMPCAALALEESTGTKQVLLNGIIRNDSWNFTVGTLVFVSPTVGTLTQIAPSATGQQVQVVGIALTADVVYFNPSPVLVEIA